MDLFSPTEVVENYSGIGVIRTQRSFGNTLLLAVLAGLLIAFGGAVTNTAVHDIANIGVARTICGMLFPFGLGMVILSGTELFTGNCLIAISVLDRRASVGAMARNLVIVYFGNLLGSLLLAAGCAFFGQLEYSGGMLAVYTIRVAAAKCAISFPAGVVLGFFCNVLVCMGVLCSLAAKDVAGRIMGAFIPVSFFVICGFEHCIANMYYIPAGLFAMQVPRYAQLAAEAGLNVSALSWGNFVVNNLLPVTIGNILGGVALGALMWRTNRRQPAVR